MWWNATVGQTLFLKHAKKLSNLIIAIQNKNKPIHQKKIEIKSKSMATDWCQNLERVKEIIITDK